MKTARFLAVAALLFVAPLARAERPPFEVTAWGSYILPSRTAWADGFGTAVDFDKSWGPGLSLNLPAGRYASVELSTFWFRPEGRITFQEVQIASMGKSSMNPYMAMLQLHPAGRGAIDPYLAGGISYTVFGTYESQDLESLGAGRIALEDTLSGVAGAGVRFAFGETFGVTLDGRYIWLQAGSKGITSTKELDLSIEPVIVSVGASIRF